MSKEKRIEELRKQRNEFLGDATLALRAVLVTLREERDTRGKEWHDIFSEHIGGIRVALREVEQLTGD